MLKRLMANPLWGGIAGSALFFVFFQPTLQWLMDSITAGGPSVFAVYVDHFYEVGARANEFYASGLLLLFANSALCGIYLIFTFNSIRTFKDTPPNSPPPETYATASMNPSRRRKIALGIGVISLLFLIHLINSAAETVIATELNVRFRQRVHIVSPHIEDRDLRKFYSLWASMQTRHDYKEITATLKTVCTTNNLFFPTSFLD